MNFAIECCCSRKTNNCREMSERKKQERLELAKNLSDIYELVMTPCENVPDMPETFSNVEKEPIRKKLGIYVNFVEDMDSPLTPRTPDVNENMINLSIPKGRDVYVNYQKYNFT